jgi:hypothetical protein
MMEMMQFLLISKLSSQTSQLKKLSCIAHLNVIIGSSCYVVSSSGSLEKLLIQKLFFFLNAR